MYFDGENSIEGSGVGVLLISPTEKTFKFYFTLLFTCTNNTVEYETLLIGLRLASKNKIINLGVVGDSELVVS